MAAVLESGWASLTREEANREAASEAVGGGESETIGIAPTGSRASSPGVSRAASASGIGWSETSPSVASPRSASNAGGGTGGAGASTTA